MADPWQGMPLEPLTQDQPWSNLMLNFSLVRHQSHERHARSDIIGFMMSYGCWQITLEKIISEPDYSTLQLWNCIKQNYSNAINFWTLNKTARGESVSISRGNKGVCVIFPFFFNTNTSKEMTGRFSSWSKWNENYANGMKRLLDCW